MVGRTENEVASNRQLELENTSSNGPYRTPGTNNLESFPEVSVHVVHPYASRPLSLEATMSILIALSRDI